MIKENLRLQVTSRETYKLKPDKEVMLRFKLYDNVNYFLRKRSGLNIKLLEPDLKRQPFFIQLKNGFDDKYLHFQVENDGTDINWPVFETPAYLVHDHVATVLALNESYYNLMSETARYTLLDEHDGVECASDNIEDIKSFLSESKRELQSDIFETNKTLTCIEKIEAQLELKDQFEQLKEDD